MVAVELCWTRTCRTPNCDGVAPGRSGIDAYCRRCAKGMQHCRATAEQLARLPPAFEHVSRVRRSHVARLAIKADYARQEAERAVQQAKLARDLALRAHEQWLAGLKDVVGAQR